MNVLEAKVEEVFLLLTEKSYEVYDIFKNFFEEQYVDLHLVHSIDNIAYIIKNEIPMGKYIDSKILNDNSIDIDNYMASLQEKEVNIVIENINVCKVVDWFYNRFDYISEILVHFPHVTITNEYNRSTEINHLFAKVKIDYKGSIVGGFSLNRSEYTYTHMLEHYMHSHVRDIPVWNFEEFQLPCTGSGPINDTIASLSIEFDADLWNLFCLELSKYVCVESVSGVPYHHLEHLGQRNSVEELSDFNLVNSLLLHSRYRDILYDFLDYFLSLNKLKFNYNHGSYALGMSFVEYNMIISNEFIKWYNKKYASHDYRVPLSKFLASGIMCKCIISGNKILHFRESNNRNSFEAFIGKKVCTFKGKDYTIVITGLNTPDSNEYTHILSETVSACILSIILKVINYKYGKERNNTSDSTCKKTRYI